MCRRPKFSLGEEEDESVGSKTVTALLGLGLLAAVAFAAYTFTTPSANAASEGRAIVTQPSASPVSNAPAQPEPAPQPEAAAAASDPAKKPAEAVTAEQQAEAPSKSKSKRMRTVGKKIVDPRLIEARKSVKVTMYSAPWCFICDRARSFLEAREVDLTEHDVDMDPEAEKRLAQLNPTGSIPTFIVDGKTIVGFHPWGLEDSIDVAAQQHFCVKNTQGAVCERLASAR